MMNNFMCFERVDHHNHLPNQLTKMLDDLELTDCTLYCDDGKIQAHKVVLASSSAYFKSVFMNMEEQGGNFKAAVIMKDTKIKDLEYIIRYIYSGSINVPIDDVTAVLEQASTLKINGFANPFTRVTSTPNKGTMPPASFLPSPVLETIHANENFPIIHANDNIDLEEIEPDSQLTRLAQFVEDALVASNLDLTAIPLLPIDDSETDWRNFTANSVENGDVEASPVFAKLPKPVLQANSRQNIDSIQPPVRNVAAARKDPKIIYESVQEEEVGPSKKQQTPYSTTRSKRKHSLINTLKSDSEFELESVSESESESSPNPVCKKSNRGVFKKNQMKPDCVPATVPVRRNARRKSTMSRKISPYVFF